MYERSLGYIHLGTTTNFQDICKFTSLRTGRRITRKQLTPLPMPQSLINQVGDMSIKEYYDEDIILIDRSGVTFEVYNYDVNTNDFTSRVDNNYNSYNCNNIAYEDSDNNK